jgi:hypothetical protein
MNEDERRSPMRTTVRSRCVAALVCAAVVTTPVAANAQPAPAPPVPAPAAAVPETVEQARSHFAHGVKLYEEEDYRAALIEFSRAYELAPNWAVLYNVGQSHYQLRDYPNALRTMEKYVKEGGEQIGKDRRAEVDREMDELRGRVAHVSLTVNIPGAELTLDDAAIGKTPLTELVLVGAGRHKLAASKSGYVTATKVLDIAGGDNLTIALELTSEEARSAASQPALPASAPNYLATGVFMGLGVAGIAVGAIFGVATIGNKSSLNGACDPTTKLCPSSEQGDIDAFSRNGAISTAGFGVGVVGLALGTYFLVHELGKGHAAPDASPPPKSAMVRPWLGIGSAGLAGTF